MRSSSALGWNRREGAPTLARISNGHWQGIWKSWLTVVYVLDTAGSNEVAVIGGGAAGMMAAVTAAGSRRAS